MATVGVPLLAGSLLAQSSATPRGNASAPSATKSAASARTDSARSDSARADSARTDSSAPVALPKVHVAMEAAQSWQNLDQKNDPGTLPQLGSGFQEAVGNVFLTSTLTEGIDAYVELYLSSKHHAGQVFDREGYVLISKVPDAVNVFNVNRVLKYMNIKAGHFEVDFGNQHLVRSDNGEVMKNPLVGNYVVDPNTVEAGFELISHVGLFHSSLGLGNGVTTESFDAERHYSKHGKVWFAPENNWFNVAGSFYTVDQSGNPNAAGGGSFTEMFSGNRSGSRYASVLTAGDPEAGQIKIGKGQKLTAFQGDGEVNLANVRLAGLMGWVKDADINGSDAGTPTEKWTYWGGEMKFSFTSQIFAATRYSRAHTSSYNGDAADANVWRYQGGVGIFVIPEVLIKAEYVYQKFSGFEEGAFVGNPRFHGVVLEAGTRIPIF
ncbi:MAG TPA: hypothetical protein VFK13_07210 [Gemmatimonadaceae bacterium]|nr:hypothetical protein [Gemmatimonadaceae bacterium]